MDKAQLSITQDSGLRHGKYFWFGCTEKTYNTAKMWKRRARNLYYDGIAESKSCQSDLAALFEMPSYISIPGDANFGIRGVDVTIDAFDGDNYMPTRRYIAKRSGGRIPPFSLEQTPLPSNAWNLSILSNLAPLPSDPLTSEFKERKELSGVSGTDIINLICSAGAPRLRAEVYVSVPIGSWVPTRYSSAQFPELEGNQYVGRNWKWTVYEGMIAGNQVVDFSRK